MSCGVWTLRPRPSRSASGGGTRTCFKLTLRTPLHVAEVGYDPKFGARPLRRAITDWVDDPLSEGLLAERFLPGDVLRAFHEEDEKELSFEIVERAAEEAEIDEALEAMLG